MAQTGTRNEPKSKSTRAKPAGAAKTTRPRRSAKSRANEELIRSYFGALAARDVEGQLSHCSPDVVEDIVPLGVLRGHREVERFFRELFAAMPDAEISVSRVVTDDSRAVVEWRLVGTFSGGPFQGIEPTGRRLEHRGLDLFEIEDGKILRNTAYYDGMAFARGVGLLPPEDSGAERAMKGAFNTLTRLRKAVNERMAGER